MRSTITHGFNAACSHRTELLLGASFVCDRIYVISFIFARRWKQTSADSLGLVRVWSGRCSRKVFMYAKCSGSPWLLQIPAEDEGCEGKLRWEMIERGHNYTGCLFWTECCFISLTLTIKPCARASSPRRVSCSLSFIKYWWAPSYGHYYYASNNRCIYLWKHFVMSRSSSASLWLGAVPFFFFLQIILSLSVSNI